MKRSLLCAFVFAVTALMSHAQMWQRVNVGASPAEWLDVFFLNGNYGWICGFGGWTARTTDGGTTWATSQVGGADHLESIHFFDQNIGICSGPSPRGVWKTINGGATWTQLTIPAGEVWGAYMTDANTYHAVGGGCTTAQNFFRTADGGTTWTTFNGTLANSGMTDAIVSTTNGTGYAVSSGNIWRTLDGGVTWAQWSTSGTAVWQEELSMAGNSILVPYSGSDCVGTGGGGGMRMSTNSGTSWSERAVGFKMYGSFLIDAQNGWTCGTGSSIWNTTDGGVNWTLRNCGATNELDDIWFINSTTGWCVGTYVWKYASPIRSANKDSISFREACLPDPVQDTIRFRNFSTSSTSATMSLTGPDAALFSIIVPATTTVTIPACDSIVVVIRFSPTTVGTKRAVLTTNFTSPSETIIIPLTGRSRVSRSAPVDSVITVNPVTVGIARLGMAGWTNTGTLTDLISNIQLLNGSPDILFASPAISVPVGGANVGYSITARDTGWISARFRFTLTPCRKDTFVTVRAYGVSPIIRAIDSLRATITCSSNPDTLFAIEVSNGGNAPLKITNVSFNGPDAADFSFVSWVRSSTLSNTILPLGKDTLLIRCNGTQSRNYSADLYLDNNDVTLTRGVVSPKKISLRVFRTGAILAVRGDSIHFGVLCLGTSKKDTLYIRNTGNSPVTVDYPKLLRSSFQILNSAGLFPLVLQPGQQLILVVLFNAVVEGFYSDSLTVHGEPCDQNRIIPISGRAVATRGSLSPLTISKTIQSGVAHRDTVVFRSTGSAYIDIQRFDLILWTNNITIIQPTTFPVRVQPGDSLVIVLDVNSKKDTTIKTSLCPVISGYCPLTLCLPIQYRVTSSGLTISKTQLLFPRVTCSPKKQEQTVSITNEGSTPQQIVSVRINQSANVFSILKGTTTAHTLPGNSTEVYTIEADQKTEGTESGELVIETDLGGTMTYRIPLTSQFNQTRLSFLAFNSDFGLVEPCSPPTTRIIEVVNNGTLDNSIAVQRSNPQLGFDIQPTAIDIKAGGTAQFVVTSTPDQHSLGQQAEPLRFTSTTCPIDTTIDLTTLVVRPRLTVLPNSIDYQTVLSDVSKHDTITIQNNSAYPKQIESVSLGGDGQFTAVQPPYPLTLQPQSLLKIPVNFYSRVIGTFTAEVIVVETSICRDTTKVSLFSKVPSETYPLSIAMNEYSAYAGDTLTMPVWLTDSLSYRIQPKSISVYLSFNPKVLRPLTVVSRDMTTPVAHTYSSDGILSILHTGDPKDLSAKDTLYFVRGLALADGVKFTTIHFDSVRVQTDKGINVQTDDGSLDVRFCGPYSGVLLGGGLTVTVGETSTSESIEILIESGKNQECFIEIFNITGNVVVKNQVAVREGLNQLRIPTAGLSTGAYFLRAVSDDLQSSAIGFGLIK